MRGICLTRRCRAVNLSPTGTGHAADACNLVDAIERDALFARATRFPFGCIAQPLRRRDPHQHGLRFDYLVDAVDTVSAKVELAVRASQAGVPIISCMGAGNKLDPTRFEVADLFETSVCPLCKVMRKEVRRRGVERLKVVYSKEEPLMPVETEAISCRHHCVCPKGATRTCTVRHRVPGSVSFVPSVAGLIIAGEVIRGLIGREGN